MNKILAASVIAVMASTSAVIAQDAVEPNTQQRMEQQPAPMPEATNPSNTTSPDTATDPAFTPSQTGESAPIVGETAAVPTDDWLGRDVYSSDGENLGEVAALYREPESQMANIYVDVGGFLGIGSTRKAIPAAQIDNVQEDRITLKMTEGEVNALAEAQVPESGNVAK
jgi:hypothetical protein